MLDPLSVIPLIIVEVGDDGAGIGPQLRAEAVGIGLEREYLAVGADDFVFVDGALSELRLEDFPNAGGAAGAHGMHTAIPAIEIADHADAFCAGSPNGKVHARDAFKNFYVGAEFFVRVGVAAFAHEVKIEFGEEIGERIGVIDFEGFALMGAALDFVAGGRGSCGLAGRPRSFEEAFGAELDGVRDLCRALQRNRGFGGPRKKNTDGPSAGDGMRPKEGKGIGVASGKECVDLDF